MGKPSRCAASTLPPTARSSRPQRVRAMTNANAATASRPSRSPRWTRLPGHAGRIAAVGERGGLRVVEALGVAPRTEDDVVHEEDRHVVQQQGGDGLAGPPPRAQHPGDGGPRAAAGEAEQRHDGEQWPARPVRQVQSRPRGAQCADVELTLAPDVDQPDTRRHRHRERGQQQWRDLHQRLGEPVRVAQRAREDVGVGAQRIAAEHEEQQREGAQAEDEQPAEVGQRRQTRMSQRLPVIRRPISSTPRSPRRPAPTIRPPHSTTSRSASARSSSRSSEISSTAAPA